MNTETLRTICEFLLPPSGLIILLALGLFFWLIRLRKSAAFCIVISSVLLYLASTPFMARKVMDPLQYQYEVLKEVPEDVQAIVVLSGGRAPIAREYMNLDTVNGTTLERLRYASRLSKVHQLPILLSGGRVNNERQSLANLMQHVLETDFGVQTDWLDEDSKTTFENAKFSKKILKENSINKGCFQDIGLDPIAAPTVFYKRNTSVPELQEYIPNAGALKKTNTAVHEYIGKLWYKYVGY